VTTVRLPRRLTILCVLIALALIVLSCAATKTKMTEPAATLAAGQSTSAAPGASVIETSTPAQDSAGRATEEVITLGTADTLLVRSFPSGLSTYLIPQSKLDAIRDPLFEYTSDEYLVGQTPLELTLAPGEYAVSVAAEPPGYYRDDGESGQIIQVSLEEDDQVAYRISAKVYAIEKQAGHQMLVTALFWPEDQSLVEFVDALPGPDEFEHLTLETLQPILKQYGVPPKEWSLLQTMLGKTGKAVWYGDTPEQTLVITWSETAPEWKLDIGPIK